MSTYTFADPLPQFAGIDPGEIADPSSPYAAARARYPELAARRANPEAPGAWALQTFDPDPLGVEARKRAKELGIPYVSDYVGSMVVAGKTMSADELSKTANGRTLLSLAIDRKRGHKAGFWERFADIGVKDLPFFGMFAEVGGSFKQAAKVSELFQKASRGEDISDDDRILLGLYSMERGNQTTVGGMVGDIVRQAPGFMAEFLGSGGLYSAARTGLAKLFGESSKRAASVLAVDTGTKILAGELATEAVRSQAAKVAGAGVAREVSSAAIRGFDEAAKNELADRVSTSIYRFVAGTMGKSVPKDAGKVAKAMAAIETPGPYSDKFIQEVSDHIARKAVNAAVARHGASSAFREWMVGTAQGLRRSGARALLDWGTWGTETSTVLDAGFNTAKSAVADALAASFIEAPIAGAMMYLPKALVANPVVSATVGGAVGENKLAMQASAVRTGDQKLMEMAGVIGTGLDLMEYVSENAGRGFLSGMRAIGLATGLSRPAERALMGSAGELLREGAKVEAGGAVLQSIRRAMGDSTEEMARRVASDQVTAISRYLAERGAGVSDDIVRQMVRTKAVPDTIKSVVGTDFRELSDRAVKAAYKAVRDGVELELSYKNYFRFVVADMMARNNWGPDQTLNAFRRMGYHGILGEMYEERYNDFMKGLCGLDDKKTHSFRENLDRAFRGIYPERGWEQLVAEAVGFAVPSVTRAAVLNVQRVLGGSSEVDRARATGRNFRDLSVGMAVYEDRLGTFDAAMKERKARLVGQLGQAEQELSDYRRMLEGQHITDEAEVARLTMDRSARVEEAKEAIARHDEYVKKTYAANSVTEEMVKDEAGRLLRFGVIPLEGDSFTGKISTYYTSEQLRDAMDAQDSLLAEAAFLGRSYDNARQYGTGETDISTWRKIAAKTVGIAGALICCEPALAQLNSIKWASVDEGMDPHLADDLGNLHHQLKTKAITELRQANATLEPTEAEIEAKISEYGYEKSAKDIVRSRLLLDGVRMFAHSEMLDRATIRVAEDQGYYYDRRAGEFRREGATPVSLADFYAANKGAVDSLRDDIGLEVLRLLTSENTHIGRLPGQYLSFIRMSPGDKDTNQVARALAMQMSGFGNLIAQRELVKGVPVETLLEHDSTGISGGIVDSIGRYLQSDPTGGTIPSALIEQAASEMQYPAGDMTDTYLAKRKADIVATVRVAKNILTGDVKVFRRHVDIGESRLYDDTTRTVIFERDPRTGLWSTTDEVRNGEPGFKMATWRGNDEQLSKLVADNELEPSARGVKFVSARALSSTDPVLMLQKLGLAESLVNASRVKRPGGYDYSRVHPALRLNDATSGPALTDAQVRETLRREAFMAEYARTHDNVADYNFEKAEWSDEVQNLCVARRREYKRMQENVIGENGYLTVIENYLAANGVDCPGSESLFRAALGGAAEGVYSVGLAAYNSLHKGADYFVPVNYAAGIDPTAAMVYCAVDDGYRRYGPRFFGENRVLWNAVTTYFRDLNALVERHLYDSKLSAPAREQLKKIHDAVTVNYAAPARRSFCTVAVAIACGQAARAARRGHTSTVYDTGFLAIMDEAKSLPSYVPFAGVVDLVLGGSGFEDLRAYRAAGADAEKAARRTGLLRVLDITGDPGAPLNDLTEGMKPAGLGWAEFEDKVNEYAARNFKEAPTPSPRAEGSASVSAFGRLRQLYANAGFDSVDGIIKFLVQIGRYEPFNASVDQDSRVRRSLSNFAAQVSALEAEKDRLAREKEKLLLDQQADKDYISELQGKLIETEYMLAEAKSKLADLEAASTGSASAPAAPPQARKEVSATVEGGDARDAIPKPTEPVGPDPSDLDPWDREEFRDSVDVEPADMGEQPTHLEVLEDGTILVKEDVAEVDELDRSQKETVILSTLSAIRAETDEPVTERMFKDMLARFTDNAFPPELADATWRYYRMMRENDSADEAFVRRVRELEDLDDDGMADDGEEDGTQSANPAYGEKYAKAFSNRQLDRFLAFYRFVSPQNGREFQAGVNGIRDNIEAMKAELDGLRGKTGETGEAPDRRFAATVDFLDKLFNSEAVVEEGIENHADREALFTSRVYGLEDGSSGVTLDEMIAFLMENGEDGRPRSRQVAYFLSYLRGMRPEARRKFMTLACCSVSTRKISMKKVEGSYDLVPGDGRYISVSSFAAIGSFTGLVGPDVMDKAGLKKHIDALKDAIRGIEARLNERDAEGFYRHRFSSTHVSENLRDVAAVLAPALGHEAPILQAITSPHMLVSLMRGYGTKVGPKDSRFAGQSTAFKALALGSESPNVTAAVAGKGKEAATAATNPPPVMVKSVMTVLDRYVRQLEQLTDVPSPAHRRQMLSDIVTAEFAMGLDSGTQGFLAGNKDISINTSWAWALGAYSAGMPETVATARTLPERNPKIASKVAVSLQDAPPAIRQFVDKPVDDPSGFAYHAFRVWLDNTAADGGAAMAKADGATQESLRKHFVEKVLPRCRQRLVWPNRIQSELLAKCIDRDYTAAERREACIYSFANSFIRPAMDGKPYAKHWFVPVYNGDHSAGVIMQIPVEVLLLEHGNVGKVAQAAATPEAAYAHFADKVNSSWLGFEAFGNDSKRSSLACSEFPGRSMRGVRYRDGKLQKGEMRVHVVHNYAMEGHNDAFLGTTLATGYGLRVQQDVAKDLNSLTHKLHVMSGTGTDLTMIKSLVTAMWEYSGRRKDGVGAERLRGCFEDNLPVRVLMDHIIKFRESRGDSDISTSMVVDEDSVKVGVLNSKTMGHAVGKDKDGNATFEPLMKYIFKALASADVGSAMSGEKLDRALCDRRDGSGAPVAGEDGKFRFDWVQTDGSTVRKTVGELLGAASDDAIQVNVVEGLSGKTLDFSYRDDTLMSYTVANVSHRAKSSSGKMPRNNAVDGMVLSAGLRQMGVPDEEGSIKAASDAIASWGLLASVVGTHPDNLEYHRKTGTSALKARLGANPYGSEVTEQATRDMYKGLSDSMKPPLEFVPAPLLSCGAVFHEYTAEELADRRRRGLPESIGEVRDHTGASAFMRALHQGSRVFSKAEAEYYKTPRSLGLAHVNMALTTETRYGGRTFVEGTGFRYGLFVNEDKLDEIYEKVTGRKPDAIASDPLFKGETIPPGMTSSAKLESIVVAVVRASRAHADAMARYYDAKRSGAPFDSEKSAYDEARKVAEGMRFEVAKLFRDHVGQQLSDYDDAYIRSICFDDLIVLRSDGKRGFDRSAVVTDMPDPDTMGQAPSLWLAGTSIGLPRTPSYNGSMWSQTVRASTWCTRITDKKPLKSGKGSVDWVSPGLDAMVMPDPQTLRILGCDHDGDKSACYMYRVDPLTGVADCADPSQVLPAFLADASDVSSTLGDLYSFADDPVTRSTYLNLMVARGFVREGRAERDPESGLKVLHGPEIARFLRGRMGNTIARGYFDMSRNVPVDAGDASKPFYGTPLAKATRAQPLAVIAGKDDPRWTELKGKSLEAFNFLKGSKIAKSRTGALVSTSAGIADKARAMVVSWAGNLHLAYLSGCFDGKMFRFGGDGRENFLRWVGFMYGGDGVSNATFDDIKEQICLRLGWTSGMMDTFFCDMLFPSGQDGTVGRPPSSSDEFFGLIEKYVESVAKGGSRLWMMVTSEPSDAQNEIVVGGKNLGSTRSMKEEVKRTFGGSINRTSVMSVLGIQPDVGGGLTFDPSRASTRAMAAFVQEYLAAADRRGVASMPEDPEKADMHDYALRQLVGDISVRGGVNAASGLIHSTLLDIESGKSVGPLAEEYLRWSNGVRVMNDAREFVKSFNFLKADPGSGRMMGARDSMARVFAKTLKTADGAKLGAKSARGDLKLLATMFAANMCAYAANGANTLQGRMTYAVSVRDEALRQWTKEFRNSPRMQALLAKLATERAVGQNSLLQLEGNLTTIPFFLGSLVRLPAARDASRDLLYRGNLKDTAARTWRVMELMAKAGTSRVEGAPEPPISTAGFQRAFVSLFGALYGLVSTSSRASEFSALSYYTTRNAKLGAVQGKSGKDWKSRRYVEGAGVEQLVCEYRDKDSASQQRVWAATDLIRGGALDSAKRNGSADSFVLSAGNLRKFLAELEEADPKGRNKLTERVKTAIKVLDAISAEDKKEAELTPEALFNQLLPVYATSVARSSTPDPKSNSVLNTLRGKFQELSDFDALLDSGLFGGKAGQRRGMGFKDLLCSTDLAMPFVDDSNAELRVADIAMLDKDDVGELLDLVSRSGDGPKMFDAKDAQTLEKLLKKARGDADASARTNPRNRHYVGFLDGNQLLRSAHEYIADVLSAQKEEPARPETEAKDPSDPQADEAKPVDPGEKNPSVQALADDIAAKVATWADVTYEGGNYFTIKSRAGLKGSAAALFASSMFDGTKSGAKPSSFRTDAVITVRVGGEKPARPADINSPAFAASFCNALRLADGRPVMSADSFMRLTRPEREAVVNAYAPGAVKDGVMDFSLATPSWSIGTDGLAVLCGEIHLREANAGKLFHEYFHSMLGMFKTMGVFGEEDVKVLRAKYGTPPAGSGMLFDEEAAADAFARYATKRGTVSEKEVDGEVRTVFDRFLDAIRSILNALKRFAKYGFEYRATNLDEDDGNYLFQFVLNGYAMQSGSRLRERRAGTADDMTAESFVQSGKLRDAVSANLARYRSDDPVAAAEARMYGESAGAKDPMEGYKGPQDPEARKRELRFTKALMNECNGARRRTAVAQLVDQLTAIRAGQDVGPFEQFGFAAPEAYLSVPVSPERDANAVALDYETYYNAPSSDGTKGDPSRPFYSVSGGDYFGYVADEKFDAYMLSVCGKDIVDASLMEAGIDGAVMRTLDDGRQLYVGPPEKFPSWDRLQGRIFLSHNAPFEANVTDRLVRDGKLPDWLADAEWKDTLAMSRRVARTANGRYDLNTMTKELTGGRVQLDKQVRADMNGRHYDELSQAEKDELLAYCGDDAIWCHNVWTAYSGRWDSTGRAESEAACNRTRKWFLERQKLRAKQNAPKSEPTTEDAETLAAKHVADVGAEHPELPPESVGALAAGRAALELAGRADPAEKGGHQAIVPGQSRILRAAVNAAELAAEDLSQADLDILSGDHVTGNVYEEVRAALNARREVGKYAKARAELARRYATAAGAQLKRLTGADYEKENVLAALMYLYDKGYFKDATGRTSRRRGGSIYGTALGTSEGGATAHAARYASTATIAGAVLAAGGQRFGSVLQSAVDYIASLRRHATPENHVGETIDHVLEHLGSVLAEADITTILENGRKWNAAIDSAAMNLFTGIRRGAYDEATREFGDYVPSQDTSELSLRNRSIYQISETPDGARDVDAMKLRQHILRRAADALFATAAQVKFMREFGIAPGSIHHDAWTGRVSRQPLEFTALTEEFGIGAKTLTSDSRLVSRWNDPVFVAANLDEWYAGSVRESFGGQPVRELFLNESRKLRGHMSAMLRKVNYLAMKWGLNRLEGRKLLRLKKFEATHEMTDDFIQAVEGGKWYEGFTNERGLEGDVTSQVMTEDMIRDVQLTHQLATALLNGDDKIITGIDDITFLPDDFRSVEDETVEGYSFRRRTRMLGEADLTPAALEARFKATQTATDDRNELRKAKYRAMTGLEMALYRMMKQWHPAVTGLPSEDGTPAPAATMSLFAKFRDGAIAAANRVFAKYEDEEGNLPRGFDKAIFNHEVLMDMEAQGLVVATAEDDGKKDADGIPLRTKAALCMKASDVRDMWNASDAKKLLVSARMLANEGDDGYAEEKAKRESEFTPEALVEELGSMLKDFKKLAREMPWLTRGEARYLNRIDTMIPVYSGTGALMYNMARAERDLKREQEIRISRHEMTWQNMLNDMRLATKSFEDLTDMQLRMVHDYFGTDEQGSALMAALKAGKYAEGTAKSVKTGLVVTAVSGDGARKTTLSDMCTQIYRKQLERRLMMIEGRKQADFETEDSIGRMIQQYEQASETGGAMRKAEGLNATQLYRLHGALPVNFTIGRALIDVVRGVQNSLYFRSTFTSMLFTPDMDGDPLYLANPDKFRWENAGLPDSVWQAAARWWGSRLGMAYDVTKSGVDNARAVYEAVQSAGRKDGKTSAAFRSGTKKFATLGPDELEQDSSVNGFMAQIGEDDAGLANRWGSARGLFSLDGSEALGYARHLFQTARLPGGHGAWLQRILSWSKSMSVSYSFFFPWATRWESPIAAVGALATLGSNFQSLSKAMRKSKGLQKLLSLGKKDGWIDESFLGASDVMRMMDTNDPFLNDLVMWAEAVGISMTDRLVNPKEPNKGVVVDDIEDMGAFIGKHFGDTAKDNFLAVADMLFLRQGEKAFTYALNAVKLAVGAQVAMKLRAEARRQGKAFDPIRDMRGYAEYVDSEIGGVNPLRYAWAHPKMRETLNKMFFSWQWTRTAWEAAGGGLVEDILLGGHAISKAQKKYTPWRWLRMFGTVMVGMPFLLQLGSKMLAKLVEAAFGLPPDPDDDRDKWFTWENDSKIGWTAANITPLLKTVAKFDKAFLGGKAEDWKLHGAGATSAYGAAGGAAYGFMRGGLSGAAIGAGLGAGLGAVAPSLLPEYTGADRFNTNRHRQYFTHAGKQGWEAVRWITDPWSQFISKLSMPTQKLLEGLVGFSLSNPDVKTPMAYKSFTERWTDVMSPDSAWANLLGMFKPFTMNGWQSYGDAGIVSMAFPVVMGSAASTIRKKAEKAIMAWARNDRGGYSYGARTAEGRSQRLSLVIGHLQSDAKAAGIVDFEQDILVAALRTVVPELYHDLFNALPQKPDGDFNKREVERTIRALHRVGTKFSGMLDSIKARYTKAGDLWEKAGPQFQKYVEDILTEADLRSYDMGYVKKGAENGRE